MFRSILFLIALLLSASITTLASPIEISSKGEFERSNLEKRIDHTGDGTWFKPGLGHCGSRNIASDLIVAIAQSRYDQNNGANCDQWIEITDIGNGKKVYGLTRDSCPGCGDDDLDLSPSVFKKLEPLSRGRIKIKWKFMGKNWSPRDAMDHVSDDRIDSVE
ncbi:hypothetical protein BDN72DRAFT_840261 [Pluteus cervinus]|uniref:Uncharacterized protein n=1 Tax=Pluteus cervinus TaxID=181527 RepID=A0ACD3AW10_9AGAR|nr:hypothetical protein BDN72DRAFT_840261 [Pluteus cervinus]